MIRQAACFVATGIIILVQSSYATAETSAVALGKEQRHKLDSVNGTKSSNVKSLREKEDASVEQLRQKVDAKASDADIAAVFSTVRSYTKSIQAAEDGYWDSLAVFLSPSQQAGLFLKNHPPKNALPPAAGAASPPSSPTSKPPQQYGNPPQDWKAYFGLTKDQQGKFDTANKAKAAALKTLRETQDGAIEALRQKVNSNASENDIAAAFTTVKTDMKAIQNAENSYWDTLSGFLSPTQQAKLFLKSRPKK